MHNLFAHTYPELINSTGIAVSDTSTDHYFDAQDMRGYEGVSYLCVIRSATATGTGAANIHAEMSATSSGTGTWVDVSGSASYQSTAWAADDVGLIVDVYRPMYRYVRLYVDRDSTHDSVVCAWALKYRPGLMPTSYSTALGVADVTIVVGSSGSAT